MRRSDAARAPGGWQFVFGYGSLTEGGEAPPTRTPDANGFVTDLHGHRRCWGVAMDNRETVPGYKYYRDPNGSRPALFVAFLDLVEGAGAVNGVCSPVDDATLDELDRRERNYVRVDVTERLGQPLGRTWAFVGSPDGRARLCEGREHGAAVVSREYLEIVVDGFARLGADELARFRASTDKAELPVRDLERVDVP